MHVWGVWRYMTSWAGRGETDEDNSSLIEDFHYSNSARAISARKWLLWRDWQMEPERLTPTHLAKRAHTQKERNHVDILLYQHVAH